MLQQMKTACINSAECLPLFVCLFVCLCVSRRTVSFILRVGIQIRVILRGNSGKKGKWECERWKNRGSGCKDEKEKRGLVTQSCSFPQAALHLKY